jgi:hypothetical protein
MKHGLHPNSEEISKRAEGVYKYDYLITYDYQAMLVDNTEEYEKMMIMQKLQKNKVTCCVEEEHDSGHIVRCTNLATTVLWTTAGSAEATTDNHASDSAVHGHDTDAIYVCNDHSKIGSHKEQDTLYPSEHIPTCVALKSNIPGKEDWYIYDDDPDMLIKRMFEYLDQAT